MTTGTEQRLIDFMIETKEDLAVIKTKIEQIEKSKHNNRDWVKWSVMALLGIGQFVLAVLIFVR